MTIRFSVSNEKIFKKRYSGIIKDKNVNISEDRVAFGISDTIMIGITFLFEASLSGFTWDYIKESISPYIQFLLSKKHREDIVRIYLNDTDGKTFEIDIPETYNIVDLNIPDKLTLFLKK